MVGPAPKIHVLVPGPSSSSTGCFALSLGSCDIPLPSCAPAPQGDQQDQGAKDSGPAHLPTVADSSVVGTVVRDASGTSHVAPILQDNIENTRQQPSAALHGPIGGTACFRQEFSLSKANHDLDQDDLDFLSNHLASETASGYGYVFRKFRIFCEQLLADPLTCPPSVIVKYLRYMSVSGAEYSTVNFHRSAISKFHASVDGSPVGEHPLVSQAVRAVFRLKPPLPKYQATFDIVPVLNYVRSLPTDRISLKQLSFKALFLTVYSSISRVSSMARLGPSLQEHRDCVVLHLVSLEKQARAGHVRGYLRIPSFTEDPELCPVRALTAYYKKVSFWNIDIL